VAARTLRDVLAGHLARAADRPFLVAPETGRALTYRAIDREARLLAAFLAARGLGRGDRVGLYLHNGLQTVLLFLAAMLGGFVVVPLNLLAQRSQLAYVLDHSGCRLVFTAREHERPLGKALAQLGRPIEAIVIDVDAPSLFAPQRLPARERGPASAEDPAILMYTSGTTGTPKGALLTHANVAAAAASVAAWHGLGPADRCLSSLPLYHINGQVIATLAPFVSGGSVIAPHRFSVSAWWDTVERHGATWINVVPTIIAYLLNAADPARRYRFPRVRFARSASAPLPLEHHRAFERTFGVSVIECMGMTETASVAFANPQDPARRRVGTVGLPCGVEARLVGGEIQLRGPTVISGYYRSPEQTAAAFDEGGWLKTGDLGVRDADGYYTITGRLKELIIKGGENIAPREIDEVLLRHPAVMEAAAVGIPDANYGQDIRACVVLKPGASVGAEELRAHCLAELGRYKTPREFRFVAELPKGPSGKVQRLKLAEDR
jgi:long-chain acyl-CoA synthetase